MRPRKAVRVLLIAPSLKILGGQAVQATRLLCALRKEKSIQVDFQQISPDFPFHLAFLARIKFVRTIAGVSLYTLQLLVRVWRYDIVHVFSAGYTSYLFWTIPALAVSKLFGKKIILNYRDGQAEDHLKTWRSALPTIRMMDEVVAPSGYLVDVFGEFGLRIRTISNILDMDAFIYRKRARLRPVFLHNRILEPLYNIPCTLRAFKIVQERYPEASLTIAHDGPSRIELEQFSREIGLKNTVFVGRVPHQDIPNLYDRADIYLTSPDFDCMPGSILECFRSGLPVVATAAGGIPYIAVHEQTALLVPCNDHEAMARAALRLLDEPELVEHLTKAARDSCSRYAEGPVRQQWAILYHSLLAGKNAP